MLNNSFVQIGNNLKSIGFNRFLLLRNFSISARNNKEKNVAMVRIY
jgi:hypothetical protein